MLNRVDIDVPAGFYSVPQTVTISAHEVTAQIMYTTDGSEPSATNGTLYVGPLTINQTTTLRAKAIQSGYVSLPSVTRTYLFLDDVIQQSPDGTAPAGWPSTWGGNVVDYGMDPDVLALEGEAAVKDALLALPTLSITTDLDNLFDSQIGIYSNAQQDGRDWERPASAEWINPDGSEGFQVNAGIRIRGGFSRSNNNPKHALKLFFRGQYGDSVLNYPVHGDIGVNEFKKLDLRTAQNYSWSFQGNSSNNFVAEVFARYNQRDLGQPYTRSNWIHLYLNGQYWGLFQTQERAEANYAASYFGGNAEDYDVLKPERGAYQNIATDGNFDAYDGLWQQAIARAPDGITPAFVDNAAYLRAQGKNPDGSDNLDYPVLLDVDNLIAYMVETLRGGNLDAPISNFLGNDQPNNYFAIRDRTGREGFRFFQHDAEHTMRNVNQNRNGPWNAPNFDNTVFYFNPQWLHQQLMANDEYRIRFADTVQWAFFNEGPLSESSLIEKLNTEAAKIEEAVIAESARWGDAKRGDNSPFGQANFLNAIAGLRNNYLPNRNPIVINQFRNTTLALKDSMGDYSIIVPAPLFPSIDAPSFLVNGTAQHGGIVGTGAQLRFNSPDGLVYYMTDGSDPRLFGGGIDPAAQVYDPQQISDTVVASGAVWKYLDDGSQPPTNWSGQTFDDALWASGPSQLGYGDGDEATVVSFGGDSNNKHITTYFRRAFDADLSGGSVVSVTLRVRRDDGVAVYLNGVEVVRDNLPSGTLTSTTTASSVVGGASESQWFEYSIDPSLLVDGDNLLAAEVHQISGSSSDITFDVELVVGKQNALPVTLNDSTSVRARTLSGSGEWSALSDAFFQIPNVAASPQNLRLTEINYDPRIDGDAEYIELRNITSGSEAVTIDLDGVTLTRGPSLPFPIPVGTKLGPGESVVLVHDTAAFLAAYPSVTPDQVVGEFEGRLSNGGERITLVDASGMTIADFEYDNNDPWTPWADGKGGSLVLVHPASVPVEQTGKPYHYAAGVEFGGTPAANEQTPLGIVVNEVLSHTDPPLLDSIELYNPTSTAISVGGWFLSDEADEPEKYKIPSGTTILAGGYLVFDESDFNPAVPNADGLVPFGLSSARGDSVWLFTGNGTAALALEDHAVFDATFNGVSLGRIDGSGDRLVPLANRSLGVINGTFSVSSVVISELNYHPEPPSSGALAILSTLTEQDLEFVELHNNSTSVVDLENWEIDGEVNFTFSSGDSLVPDQAFIVVSFDPGSPVNVNRLAAFREHYGIDTSVTIKGPFGGTLSNSHGVVQLKAPDLPPLDDPLLIPNVLVDELFYDDLAPWPVDADGLGPSLQRLAASTLGNYHDSWIAESPTPGNLPVRPKVESVTIDANGPNRSFVTEVRVEFDSLVSVSAESFGILNLNSNQNVEAIQVATQTVDGKTVAVLTFGVGESVIARPGRSNSLADGNYQLTINKRLVTSSATGVAMASDAYFGDEATDRFFRLFGDSNGDRQVDSKDLSLFARSFNRSVGDPLYDPMLDSDGDGDVDGRDFAAFRSHLGRRLEIP